MINCELFECEQEQIGTVRCCEKDIKIDPNHPYNPKMIHKFDEEVYIASQAITNVSMFFMMPALSEEIWDLFVAEYMRPKHGFEVQLFLSGYAYMKSTKWGFDMKVYVDCTVRANTSRFILYNQTNEAQSNRLLGNVWPPILYHYQYFPIHQSNCNYSLTSIKYIVQ